MIELINAIKNDDLEKIKTILAEFNLKLEKEDVNYPLDIRPHALKYAILCVKNIDVLNEILNAYGEDIHSYYKSTNETHIMYAAAANHPDAIKILVGIGIDIEAVDKAGKTALIYAANYGNLDSVNVLIENGATIWYRDYGGRTALDWAEIRRHQDIVEFLRLEGEK